MKIYIYVILFGFLLIACKKEPALHSSLELENAYSIKDGGSDAVNSRIYEIYKEYGVPIFFNDTISKNVLGEDVNGNPVFQYETLDFAWKFDSYEKLIYKYEYLQDEEEMLASLDVIEQFLQSSSPALYPFSFFVTHAVEVLDKGKVTQKLEDGQYQLGFRVVLVTTSKDEATNEEFPSKLKKSMVLDKISSYEYEIAEFSAVSKTEWYGGKTWVELDPTLTSTWYNNVNALYEDWNGAIWYTQQELEDMRSEARRVIGRYGFIKGNNFTKGLETPQNPNEDLNAYVEDILKYGTVEFEDLWGNHSLVMKKYLILKEVIRDKMQVEI